MQRSACEQFDFDEWARLAARDPEAFEARRAELLEDFIQTAPAERQERLRRLQWRIDRTRDCASNPISACVRISQMMWDSLLGECGLLQALEDARDGHHRARASAEVLNFEPIRRAASDR